MHQSVSHTISVPSIFTTNIVAKVPTIKTLASQAEEK